MSTAKIALVPLLIVGFMLGFSARPAIAGPQLVRYSLVPYYEMLSWKPVYKILFIGNSHTLVGDIPARVEALLDGDARFDRNALVGVVSFGGAALAQVINSGWADKALSSVAWDLVVIQHQSGMALNNKTRRNFSNAVSWFVSRVGRRNLLIYQVWPYERGLALYRTGYPRTPEQLHRLTTHAVEKVANKYGLRIAPVGSCWLRSSNLKELYQADHNHATETGAKLSAQVLAHAIQEQSAASGIGRSNHGPACP